MSQTATKLSFLRKSVNASLKKYLESFFKKLCCATEKYTSDICRNNPEILQNVKIFASGKAAFAMLQSVDKFLPARTEFFAVVPSIQAQSFKNLHGKFVEGSHPIPDEKSFRAAKQAVGFLNQSGKNLLILISGGTSALLSLPKPPLTESDKTRVHHRLVHSGLPVEKINSVRRRLSSVKGGNLLKTSLKTHDKIFLLALCDVSSGNFFDIGSGPFYPSPEDRIEAMTAAEQADLEPELIEVIKNSDTLDKSYFTKNFTNFLSRFRPFMVLDQNLAKDSAVKLLEQDFASAKALSISKFYDVVNNTDLDTVCKNTWLVTCGEKEIQVGQVRGRGGRASHNLIESAVRLFKKGINFEMAVFASDGKDGNSGLAGGYINSAMITDQKYAEMKKALENFSTADWLEANKLEFKSFETGTNVGDIHLFLLPDLP